MVRLQHRAVSSMSRGRTKGRDYDTDWGSGASYSSPYPPAKEAQAVPVIEDDVGVNAAVGQLLGPRRRNESEADYSRRVDGQSRLLRHTEQLQQQSRVEPVKEARREASPGPRPPPPHTPYRPPWPAPQALPPPPQQPPSPPPPVHMAPQAPARPPSRATSLATSAHAPGGTAHTNRTIHSHAPSSVPALVPDLAETSAKFRAIKPLPNYMLVAPQGWGAKDPRHFHKRKFWTPGTGGGQAL